MQKSNAPSWTRILVVLLAGLLFSFNAFAQPEPVVVGYYTSWRVFTYSPSEIPLDNVTHVLHSFAYPDASGNINHPTYFLDPVPELIQTVHAGGRKVFVALGGWNDSDGFSPMAASASTRANFISNITNFCLTHGYDGVDLDWEYPANATDMANLNLLVSELDAYWSSNAPNLELSMAIPAGDWSAQFIDVAFLAPYVQWFGIMTYDYHGNWSDHTGHLSPLYLDPADPGQCGSVDTSIEDYYHQQRGVPYEKLVAGIPFYGKKFTKSSAPYQTTRFRATDLFYNEIVPIMGNYTYVWDDVAQVPYLSGGEFITFNDETSCGLVCDYAKNKGLKGVMVWELSQNELADGSQPLIDVIGESMLGSGSPVPPDAPSNLVATPVASSQINLSWSDNSSNEHGFKVERSLDGVNFTEIAETGEGVTGYPDINLTPETTYHYRVLAFNGAGVSAYTNVASATTPASGGGGPVADLANGDIAVDGTVSGSYVDTQDSDDVYESIEEVEQLVGPPSKRFSYLEHKWTIDVTGGVSVIFYVEAYKTASPDGDNFVFAYSTDNDNFTNMVTVTKTSDDDSYQSYELPGLLSGTVYIRVTDSNHTKGARDLDTIFIDHLYVESETLGKKTVDYPSVETPAEFSLLHNYPNPFNPTTTISYTLPDAGNVSLIVYDVMGRQVNTLVDGYRAAGEYKSVWNAVDESGAQLASGVYYAQLRNGSNLQVIKMVLMR